MATRLRRRTDGRAAAYLPFGVAWSRASCARPDHEPKSRRGAQSMILCKSGTDLA